MFRNENEMSDVISNLVTLQHQAPTHKSINEHDKIYYTNNNTLLLETSRPIKKIMITGSGKLFQPTVNEKL